MTTFAHLPLAQITASLTNPRKTFDAGKLAELAASITASGVHQAVLVRPLPGDRVADTDRGVLYELVTGKKEARWIGKTGTVQRQVGPQAWDVCFTAKVARPITGKNVGELQSFHVTEMEVVE